MAIQSYGYPTLIAPGGVWAQMQYTLGRQYAVPFAGDCKVTDPGVGTRRVQIAPGYLGGKGILDHNDAIVNIDLPEPVGQNQWFAIVLNRWVADGNGGFRSQFGYVAGTATQAIPSLTKVPGTADQQAIALVRLTSGQTRPQSLIDLRAVAEESGVYTIQDNMAMELLGAGTQVYNVKTGLSYRAVIGSSGNIEWQRLGKKPGALLAIYEGGFHPLAANGRNDPNYRVWGRTPEDLASVAIPDPGVPYRVQIEAYGEMGSEDGNVRWDFHGRIGANRIAFFSPHGQDLGMAARHIHGNPSTQIFTGANTAYLTAYKVTQGGSPYGGITVHNRRMTAAVYEA